MAASSYVKPVSGDVRRLDQGIDYQGKPGANVVAIGLARVDAVKDDPGGFGKVVYYTLLDGPARGQQVYVGHAAPVVHQGQVVQAGTPVAVLQQRSGGNAANLPGWTEIGFAKGGVPESRSESDTGSAKRFQAFLADLKDAPPADTQAPAAPDAPEAATATPTPAPPTAGQDPDYQVSPSPLSTQPLEPPPGSGMTSTNGYVTDLWNRIASQSGASPDTLALAQNAQLAGG